MQVAELQPHWQPHTWHRDRAPGYRLTWECFPALQHPWRRSAVAHVGPAGQSRSFCRPHGPAHELPRLASCPQDPPPLVLQRSIAAQPSLWLWRGCTGAMPSACHLLLIEQCLAHHAFALNLISTGTGHPVTHSLLLQLSRLEDISASLLEIFCGVPARIPQPATCIISSLLCRMATTTGCRPARGNNRWPCINCSRPAQAARSRCSARRSCSRRQLPRWPLRMLTACLCSPLAQDTAALTMPCTAP